MTVEAISQKREPSTLHSCLKRVTYSFTRKQRQRRVTFSEPITTEQWDSVWCCKDEIQHYRKELKEKYPSPSHSEKAKRRCEYEKKKWVIRKKINEVNKFFDINPLGVAKKNNTEPLAQTITKEVKSIKEELLFAPAIFKNIHPFDTIMVSYFNSIGKSKLDSSCSPRIRIKDPNFVREKSFYPSRFLPLMIERDLWRFRQAQFRQHFSDLCRSQGRRECNHSQLPILVQDMATKGVLSPYVADPFSYFSEELKYKDYSVRDREVEEISNLEENEEWRDLSPKKLQEMLNGSSDELQWIIEEKIQCNQEDEEGNYKNDENYYFTPVQLEDIDHTSL